MKALRSFTVRPSLPPELGGPGGAGHEPALVVGRPDPRPVPLGRPRRVGRHRPRPRAPARPGVRASGSTRWPTTPASCASSARCATSCSATSTATAGSRPATGRPCGRIAYFSPEFGIAEALPQYSGGLGVLAGDHLKAASDLGLPLVGIGLFYRHGYFRQSLSADGWQQERYPDLDPHAMALHAVRRRPGRGRPRRHAARRPGVAGRRRPHPALPARRRRRGEPARRCATSPTASTAATPSTGCARRSSSASAACAPSTRSASTPRCSTPTRATPASSASSASASSSRTRASATAEAIEAVRAGCIFTTHTPVPAGIDRFPRELIERYFGGWAAEVGITARRADGPRPPPRRRRPTSASTWP